MYKDHRYINAGTNEFYRWGHKAVEKATAALTPNEKGYFTIPADGGAYWTFGTSDGKYGEYAKIGDTYFSVNSWGNIYAKADTDKGDKFVSAISAFIQAMKDKHNESAIEYAE